jgi:peptide/nickel transport system substrate-binding protein
VIEWPTTELLYLTLNNLAKPTNDMAVRQAIKLAIDRKGIVEKILGGHGALANTYIAPICFGSYASDPMIFDPEKAKKVLADAGWVDSKNTGIREKDGEKLTLKIRYPSGRYPMCDEMVAVIQNQLNAVGIECLTEKMGFGAWITALVLPPDKSTGDAFIVSWPSKEDAQWALWAMQPGTPLSFYQNKEVEALTAKQFQEWDKEKRKEILKQIQIIADREAFGVNIYFMNYNIVKRKGVQGVGPVRVPVSDTFNVLDAWLE